MISMRNRNSSSTKATRGETAEKRKRRNRLFKAIKNTNISGMRKICSKHSSLLVEKNSDGQTPLHYALGEYFEDEESQNEADDSASTRRTIIQFLIQASSESLLIQDTYSRLPIHIVATKEAGMRILSLSPRETNVCWGMGKRDVNGHIPLEVGLQHRLYPETIEALYQMTVREIGTTTDLFLMHSAIRFRSPLLLLEKLEQLERATTSEGEGAISNLAASRLSNGDSPLHVELQSSRPRWAVVRWLARLYPNAATEADSYGDFPLQKVCQHDFSLTMVYSILRECPLLLCSIATSTKEKRAPTSKGLNGQ